MLLIICEKLNVAKSIASALDVTSSFVTNIFSQDYY